MNDLPDANVWLSLSVPAHPHHERAVRYWTDEAAAMRSFERVTWLALPRLLSDRRVFGEAALDGAAAWNAPAAWTERAEVTFTAEPTGIDDLIERWADELDLRAGDWTDAYLAAFSVLADLRLVSFDGGFARFPGLAWLHLEP